MRSMLVWLEVLGCQGAVSHAWQGMQSGTKVIISGIQEQEERYKRYIRYKKKRELEP